MSTRRWGAATIAVAMIAVAGCGDESTADGSPADDTAPAAVEDSDVSCTQDALAGGDAAFDFVVAYPVVDGDLGEACLQEGADADAQVLLGAWESLVAITPPDQLNDLGLFAGFVPADDTEADTLAFVNTLDVDGSLFQMSVNLDTADGDPDELLLTLAHEFSHVFAATPSQLDRTAEGIEACDTYDNGEGCYLEDALIYEWLDAFWEPDVLAEVDPFGDPLDEVSARCDADAGFFGSYAATNPEEDFAEAFSAFVFRLEPISEGQEERLEWLAEQPGLAEFRDRADAAGLTPIDNIFDRCGA